MATGFGELKVFSGSAHPELTREIAAFLGAAGRAGAAAALSGFGSLVPDRREHPGHRRLRGAADVRARSIEHLIELLIMIDAFRRSSAARITAVLPYYGYARQDRKDKPRVPISAKLVANVLSAAGTNRVLTMDLHKAQIQGFFDIPVDHLFAAPVIIDYLSRLDHPKLTLVSPDAGGAERARAYAKRLDAELAVIDKRRTDDGTAEVMNVIGDVAGRTCIIQDDIIDTAGTITKAASALKANGAARDHRLRRARRAVGAGDRADREVADRQADRDQHDPARRRRAARAARWSCCRWRACSARRSRAFTRRRRSLRCSCRPDWVRMESTGSASDGDVMEATLEATAAGHVRQERGAADAPRAGSAGGGLRRAKQARKATPIAVEPRALLKILHSESGPTR